jgi:hypothetical protein
MQVLRLPETSGNASNMTKNHGDPGSSPGPDISKILADSGKRSNCLPGQAIETVEYRSPRMARYHRLAVRHERQVEIHEAFLQLGCCLICLNYLS